MFNLLFKFNFFQDSSSEEDSDEEMETPAVNGKAKLNGTNGHVNGKQNGKQESSDDDSDDSEEAAPVKAKATPAKAAAKKEKSSEP